MAGYTRQEAANITNGNTIQPQHFNNEYNAIQAAFSASSGHKHDGTSAEGAPITVIGPNQEFEATAAALVPSTNAAFSLGTTGLRYTTGWFSGVVTAAGGFSGNLTGNVTGNVTGNLTGAVTGNASTATALQTSRTISLSGDVTGSASFNGTANAAITATLANSGVTAGTYGSGTVVPRITVDAKGRITGVTTVTVDAGGGAAGNDLFAAETAAEARTVLGATSVGSSLFTAASASAARTTLGSTSTGDALFTASSASAARTTLGAGTTGGALFTAATAASARTTLDVQPTADPNFDGEVATTDGYVIEGSAGTERYFDWRTGTGRRFTLYATSTAEASGNVGSDLQLDAWSNSNTFLGNVLSVKRSTQVVNFAKNFTIGNVAASPARAWVNFNGTGTVAIRGSSNVSSITDMGVGDFIINFTSAFANTNYSVVGSCSDVPGVSTGVFRLNAFETWGVGIYTQRASDSAVFDPVFVCAAAFGT